MEYPQTEGGTLPHCLKGVHRSEIGPLLSEMGQSRRIRTFANSDPIGASQRSVAMCQ